jgi:DNA-binding transcriptional regulator YiaG
MTPTDIKHARKSLGLTQAQIAPLLGYAATPRVSELERGERMPGACAVLLLQAYLDGYRPKDWPVGKGA